MGRQLYDAARHRPAVGAPWCAGAARTAIERIVADTQAAFTPHGLWPIHPDDAEGDETGPHCSVYMGAGGVMWALEQLAREGAVPAGPDFTHHLPEVLQRNRRDLSSDTWRRLMGAGWHTRSWLMGDAGLLFLDQRTTRDPTRRPQLLSDLAEVVELNIDDPAREQVWGSPGTMLAAAALHQAGAPGPWAKLYRASADALEAALAWDEAFEAEVWTQELYGRRTQYLGAGHGFAGAAHALIVGRDLMDAGRWSALSQRLAASLRTTAVRGDAGVNWPIFGGQPIDKPYLLQHCHGAPGVISSLSELDQDIDDLLLDAGRLIWTAGPLTKGSGLCHGTAGNGLALLKLFARTGDELWLDRARLFAMDALATTEAEAVRNGRRRHSLWTGDIGVACFLWGCVTGAARFPSIDLW